MCSIRWGSQSFWAQRERPRPLLCHDLLAGRKGGGGTRRRYLCTRCVAARAVPCTATGPGRRSDPATQAGVRQLRGACRAGAASPWDRRVGQGKASGRSRSPPVGGVVATPPGCACPLRLPHVRRGRRSGRSKSAGSPSGQRVRPPMSLRPIRCRAFRRCAMAGWTTGCGMDWRMPGLGFPAEGGRALPGRLGGRRFQRRCVAGNAMPGMAWRCSIRWRRSVGKATHCGQMALALHSPGLGVMRS